jgi:hypothetical protein
MKTTLALCVLIAFLLQLATTAPARDVPAASQPAAPGKGDQLAALEGKLLGTWTGPACGGDYTFHADGTFDLRHFTPGNNTLTGTWSVRWDALPPTLVLTCKTSDIKANDPGRPEYEYLGKALELKLLELSGDTVAFRHPNEKGERRYERRAEK